MVRRFGPAKCAAIPRSGRAGAVAETPKNLANCHNFIIGDIKLALEAMSSKATELGLHPFVITGEQSGETSEAARARAREIKDGKYLVRYCDVGWETTPRLPIDHGEGGRNQHYAAASLLEMKGHSSPWTVASVVRTGRTSYRTSPAPSLMNRHCRDSALGN